MTRTSRRRRRVLVRIVAIALAMSAWTTESAHAIDLYAFVGIVADASGAPLAGATVSDGTRSATTGADGRYRLPEGSTGTFVLRASRPGNASSSKTVSVLVPLDQTVDFELLYTITGTLGRQYLDPSGEDVTTKLVVLTGAPNPGTPGTSGTTCVYVRDTRTSSTTAANHTGTQGGLQRWEWTLLVPQGAANGTFSLEFDVKDCATSRVLSVVGSASYVIDSIAPAVSSLTPFDGMNTVFASQPLQVRAADEGPAGLASATFELTDKTSPTTTTRTANFVQGLATSAPVTLVDGHDYTLSVTVRDRAGNETTESHDGYPSGDTGFRKVASTASAAPAAVAPVACTVSGPLTERVATCPNVSMSLGTSALDVSDSRHSYDVSFATHAARLTAATITWEPVPGQPQTVNAYDRRNSVGGEWNERFIDYRYELNGDTFPAATIGRPPTEALAMGALAVKLPAEWAAAQSVVLAMSSSTVPPQGAPSRNACADPLTNRSAPCTTDPTWNWFTVVLSSSTSVDTIIAQHKTLGVEVTRSYMLPDGSNAYEALIPPRAIEAVATTPGVQAVHPMRSPNLYERLEQIRSELATSPVDEGDTLTWTAEDGSVISIPLSPTSPVAIQSEADFEVADGDPMLPSDPPQTDPPATAAIEVLTLRPQLPGLQSDVAQAAVDRNYVRYDGDDYRIEVHPLARGGVRIIGVLESEIAPTSFDFELELPDETELTEGANGEYFVQRSLAGGGDVPVGIIDAPFAYDAYGRDVAVVQTATETSVHVEISPTEDAKYPIIVDPSYYKIWCYAANRAGNTFEYAENIGHCPYGYSFYVANGYFPVAAKIQGENGGWRQVYQSGDCSGPPPTNNTPDTGPWWDFQVPCKMHDFCWDLARVSPPFEYWAVDPYECDDLFFGAMEENCSSRSQPWRTLCQDSAIVMSESVRAAAPHPAGNERNGQPENFLRNNRFLDGTKYWAKTPSTAQWLVYKNNTYQNDGTTYLEFNCGNNASGCSVRQDDYDTMLGGEYMSASAELRCRYTDRTCPIRMATWCLSNSTGYWVQTSYRSLSLSTPNQYQYNVYSTNPTNPVPLAGMNDNACSIVRFEVFNDSSYKNVDIRWASMSVAPPP